MTDEPLNRAARRQAARDAGELGFQVKREEEKQQSGFRILQDCYICSSYVEGLKRGAYSKFDQLEATPAWRVVLGKVPKGMRGQVETEVRAVFAKQSFTAKMLMDNPTVKKIIEFGTRPMLGKLKGFHERDAPELVVLHKTAGAW